MIPADTRDPRVDRLIAMLQMVIDRLDDIEGQLLDVEENLDLKDKDAPIRVKRVRRPTAWQ